MDRARLFWAVSFPEEIKRKLYGLQSRLREVQADVKWVEQQNLHLTVKFLGEVERSGIDDILQTVQGAVAGTGTFTLELAGTGFFPGPRNPRVIWVGVRGQVDKFRHLHQCVDASLAVLGFAPDSRRFSPHLTLGRMRSPRGSDALVNRARQVAEELGSLGTVEVSTIELIASRLTRGGPVYSLLAGVDLEEWTGEGGACVPRYR